MNWNEWRRYCTEHGLTTAQTSESWTNYKNMILIAQDAALAGFSSDDIMDEDWRTGPNEPIHEQIREVAESINEAISEVIEDNTEEEERLLDPEYDEQLFLDLEDDSKDILESFANIKDRIEYYEARAKIIRREADEAAEQYARDIRRSLD